MNTLGLLALWTILGILLTARVRRFGEDWKVSWSFHVRETPGKGILGGPVIWMLMIWKWLQ